MKTYLNALNEREQWMVIGASLCLAVYFYYLFLYEPLNSRVHQKTQQLIEKTDTLAWMKQINLNQISNHAHKKKALDNSKLLGVLASQLKEKESLQYPYQLQQTSSGDIQLSFDAIPFVLFMNWLSDLDKKYAITIKQLEAEQTEKEGITRLMIVFNTTLPAHSSNF